MAVEKILNTTNSIGSAVIKFKYALPLAIISVVCFILGIINVTKKLVFSKSVGGNVLNDVCVSGPQPGPSPGPSPELIPGFGEYVCKNINYTYRIDNQTYSKKSTIYSPKKYKPNDPILISYNPDAPDEHRVGSIDNRMLGISMIICSIIMFLAAFLIYRISSQRGVGTVATVGEITGMFKTNKK